jgi:alpha-L-fucosidase
VLHPTDEARLMGFAERRRAMFGEDLAAKARPGARGGSGGLGTAETWWREIDLGRHVPVSIARLEEPIERGQVVSSFELAAAAEGEDFAPLARGTTIGYARLERFTPRSVRRVRVTTVHLAATPAQLVIRLYA